MIRWIYLGILFRFVQSTTDQYLFSNFHLKPEFAILNSTGQRTFLCTKLNDNDEEDFEIVTQPPVPYERIKIYEKRLNGTAIEITVQANEYIGFFKLICSSFDNRSVGIEADVLVGSLPDRITQVDNCIVFENQYIDCVVRAPVLAMAIENKYPCHFDLNELRSTNVYKQPPDIIGTDSVNKTITFRWFPLEENVFPIDTQVLIIGDMRFFGSTRVIINLTPHFFIQSNFTLKTQSTSDIQIEFHQNHLGDLICRGNSSTDEQSRQDLRFFKKRNPTSLHLTNLSADTWYQVCFQCYRADNVTTISKISCQRIQTHRSLYSFIYLLIFISILFPTIIVLLIFTIKNWSNSIKQRLCVTKKSKNKLNQLESLMSNETTTPDLRTIFNVTNEEENQSMESNPLASSTAE